MDRIFYQLQPFALRTKNGRGHIPSPLVSTYFRRDGSFSGFSTVIKNKMVLIWMKRNLFEVLKCSRRSLLISLRTLSSRSVSGHGRTIPRHNISQYPRGLSRPHTTKPLKQTYSQIFHPHLDRTPCDIASGFFSRIHPSWDKKTVLGSLSIVSVSGVKPRRVELGHTLSDDLVDLVPASSIMSDETEILWYTKIWRCVFSTDYLKIRRKFWVKFPVEKTIWNRYHLVKWQDVYKREGESERV